MLCLVSTERFVVADRFFLWSGVCAESTLVGSQTVHRDQTQCCKIEGLSNAQTYGSWEAIEIVNSPNHSWGRLRTE
jgi:hypothetical protein